MVNKRGQFFALYLVMFTLFLCFVVIGFYIVQQRNAEGSLVSPRAVLDLRDDLTVFEMKEIEIMKSSFKSASGTFGSDEFKDSFREKFIDGVMADKDMTKFLFNDLFIKKAEIRDEDKDRGLLEDGIYPGTSVGFGDDGLNFGRMKIEKRILLTAKQEGKIDFPVYFTFEFGQKYLIDKSGKVIKMETA